MSVFRRADNRQAITGLFLLVLLAVFAGPNTLPRLLSSIVPLIDEGIPCSWLKNGQDRAQHQSLIGRAATNPIEIRVKSSTLPTTADGRLVITITIINVSIGTVPIVFNPAQVIVGDNGSSGVGLIFNPPSTLSTGAVRQNVASFAETDIRVLGPRQRCVHKVEFPASQISGTLATGSTTVVAYYRSTSRGQAVQSQTNTSPVIFVDQGLWTGYVESDPVFIPLASQ